ncbi:asparagine synthase (glutamine-hydrolyzing) [Subsaxibacter sp. CAU 1640]|uniref:asparagine synthase (glutamine-hydrolyzing) n=1 Tax=Subsaxibacter sp. CAU 1640 TaxID=2933271 RepID=UPI002006C1D5|nr:asparagine synthase (glutamine-hydrolyzing) [Subsaxibacter sp. CAU 1640]MCK7591034.1 asparagine synthase (glutamine-hydrolyzing) [Subsaxibacter sp. CAU 1640]
MCGINGIVYKNSVEESVARRQLKSMNDLIIHRGPDDEGNYIKSSDNHTVAMGMRRLSIIDLHTGNQPMFSEDEQITLVFNGEIYNFKKLREELVSKGVKFATKSDTEVVLKLYETYGEQSFAMLDGMFGLSIHDKKRDKIFIARDFFGEKPLYYTHTSNSFFWASELKSIIQNLSVKPQICKEGLNLYFRLTYIPAPFTIYETIYKLESNSYLDYDLKTFSLDIRNIHEIKNTEKIDISFQEARNKTANMVYKSVESRSISDVPLGTFLSGGVDSSIVSYCLADMTYSKIDTFSIGFEKKSYDETDKSRIVAKLINSNHHEFIISETDLKSSVDEILLNFDEPFADSSSLPTYLVSNKTKAHVKVALTGDGGDEIFGGYNKYYIGKLNRKYTSLVPEFVHNSISNVSNSVLRRKDDNRGYKYKINKLLKSIDYSDEYYWDIISLGFDKEDINALLSEEFQHLNTFSYFKEKTSIANPKSLSDFRMIDKHISLEGDMLVKVDRTSMLNSLECRAPFLNREIFEFTMSLPEDYLMKKWNKKYILKEAFKNKFPDRFLEKSKHGFGVPVGDWLRQGLKDELLRYSDADFIEKQGIFNYSGIDALINNHLTGKADNTFKVWSFFCFQKWYLKTYNPF